MLNSKEEKKLSNMTVWQHKRFSDKRLALRNANKNKNLVDSEICSRLICVSQV
jgi:hypothetical protein